MTVIFIYTRGGAWWAAVCGVAQSQTRLKQLSSSSSSSSIHPAPREKAGKIRPSLLILSLDVKWYLSSFSFEFFLPFQMAISKMGDN